MKKITLLLLILSSCIFADAQDLYWVFFTDKNNTQFDPYSYFDSKAIERRAQLGLSLYDSSDFPLNANYVDAVTALSEEVHGQSRWLNALAISTFQIEQIQKLPFVANVQTIESYGRLARTDTQLQAPNNKSGTWLSQQLQYMRGEEFVNNGFDGKGIRIAVLDGGFKMADTHPAFQHLRQNSQIIKTYNFPLKKEDVYGWDSHGTMVLSCIAGMRENRQLGLATGAEFLLARTETDLETAKEEIWWTMGMEWADANGANIINSSLGYGKDRYNPEDMNGTSVVARAAQMACSKGILVCNSMGNEGDDRSWRTLITPADADGVLSVGGIEATGKPSSFTSWGPTADGRRKPNVCAFGTAEVANPSKIMPYTTASGTSFASPLTAGFAACAWQTHRQWTNTELMRELEKSGDKYPYYDYQFGYGVPQADYFVGKAKTEKKGTIMLSQTENGSIRIEIPEEAVGADRLLYHIENEDGTLVCYKTMRISKTERIIPVQSSALREGQTLRVWYNGEVAEYKAPQTLPKATDSRLTWTLLDYHDRSADKPRVCGANAKFNFAPYVSWGFLIPTNKSTNSELSYGKSESFLAGLRFKGNICKWYSLGCALELGATWYHQPGSVNLPDWSAAQLTCRYKVRSSFLQGEFYQRFRLVPCGLFGYGIYFDTGIYAGWLFSNRIISVAQYGNNGSRERLNSPATGMSKFQWGVRARFGYDLIAVYVQYRINRLNLTANRDFTPFEAGLQLTLPLGR